MSSLPRVRCAIYTRKSSEEGLEQSFNSLDAQREACGAYILSQASEGWAQVADTYDDGGLSGGTLERPALQRLLADIAAGKIDIVVVYKVDRLTRSLLDFSKLVEALDRAGTSFVSVTQSFNTTTSMGRLTLNMLLSFAQFEREVTAERIRDKIAASKARGMWMGGTPPLGYAPDGRTLQIVEAHADLIRDIFRRYLVLGNVRLLQEQLRAENIRAPARATSTGKPVGGGVFSRGQLYHLLSNRIYVGEISHKGTIHPGLHEAIIDRAAWDQVQALLASNRQGEQRGARAASPSLFAGKVVDAKGEPLIATHASKKTAGSDVRYRYYVSRALAEATATTGLRVPARELETAVIGGIAADFEAGHALISREWLRLAPADYAPALAQAAAALTRVRAREWTLVRELVSEVRVEAEQVRVTCHTSIVAKLLRLPLAPEAAAEFVIVVPARLKRSGHVMRLVHDSGARSVAEPEQSMVTLLARAHRLLGELRRGDIDVTALAAREGVCRSYVCRLVRLALLSPQVTEAILAGRQRDGVDAALLKASDAIDASWKVQAQRLLPA